MFRAAELCGPNVRLFLTEPCRYPHAWSAMPPSSSPTGRRSPRGEVSHNRLGFAYQVACVRVLGRFPRQAPIGQYLRLRTFDTTAGERLARFLQDEGAAARIALVRCWRGPGFATNTSSPRPTRRYAARWKAPDRRPAPCLTQRHGRASVRIDTRPPRCAGRHRRPRSTLVGVSGNILAVHPFHPDPKGIAAVPVTERHYASADLKRPGTLPRLTHHGLNLYGFSGD